MTRHSEPTGDLTLDGYNRVTLRGHADLADALPYLLGYHPDDSIVLIGVHGPRGRLGERIRTGLPPDPDRWEEVACRLAACLAEGGTRRQSLPDAAVVYLCHDPGEGASPREAMERLRPLAQRLRTACGEREVPVSEALFVSRGRYWSYCCPGEECCPDEGNALPRAGTSPMAAAAAFAGIHVRGSLRELERRLVPVGEPLASRQLRALDEAASALLPSLIGKSADLAAVRGETLALAERLLSRFRRASAPDAPGEEAADARDDALLTSEEAARVLIGLQDRLARDQAAEWIEKPEVAAALRLWRALARRCVGAFGEYAAAPLTLAGWVAWSAGDAVGARVALGRALAADPEYMFARLLHQACNEGVDPEPLRRCMREQRAARGLRGPAAGAL
ncbi:DUF4192 domain-containing protein [Streptomyces hoynatensis]|uniref:DUF4192 domain-containing protein n=1 Tax=Streptomyces hoynatensis TaxID=1141874 RepID=A0A3A9YPF5_9ACTN|nr:DUF4192 domain-containing protein [Streptomyces hoynatensis]RKN37860.1 DUF4192 domain-containing protein [Streptomyces hoynatensis]